MFLSSQLQLVPRDKGLKLRTTIVNPRKLLNFPKEGRAMEKKAWDFPGCLVVEALSSNSGRAKIPHVTSLVALTVKRLSTMQETRVRSLGWEDPLEKEMAIHSSTIAWKIPWTEEPGRVHSPWGHKESDTTERLHLRSHIVPKNQNNKNKLLLRFNRKQNSVKQLSFNK